MVLAWRYICTENIGVGTLLAGLKIEGSCKMEGVLNCSDYSTGNPNSVFSIFRLKFKRSIINLIRISEL